MLIYIDGLDPELQIHDSLSEVSSRNFEIWKLHSLNAQPQNLGGHDAGLPKSSLMWCQRQRVYVLLASLIPQTPSDLLLGRRNIEVLYDKRNKNKSMTLENWLSQG